MHWEVRCIVKDVARRHSPFSTGLKRWFVIIVIESVGRIKKIYFWLNESENISVNLYLECVQISKMEVKNMRISDNIKGLLLQRINPLRIKINDPQKCRLAFKLNWLDASITISFYDSSAISNIKTRFLRCNMTAAQTEFQFFILSLIWDGLDRPQGFQSFHPRNYSSSYSYCILEGNKAGSWV